MVINLRVIVPRPRRFRRSFDIGWSLLAVSEGKPGGENIPEAGGDEDIWAMRPLGLAFMGVKLGVKETCTSRLFGLFDYVSVHECGNISRSCQRNCLEDVNSLLSIHAAVSMTFLGPWHDE